MATGTQKHTVRRDYGVEMAILGLLRRGPSYAYELHQALQTTESLHYIWTLKQSNFYALLKTFEDAGYVSNIGQRKGIGPRRRMLRLTALGELAFTQWLETPVSHGRDFRLEFLAKLVFAVERSNQSVASLIDLQREACEEWIAEMEYELGVISSERSLERLVLQFRLGQLHAIQTWLEMCNNTLAIPHRY